MSVRQSAPVQALAFEVECREQRSSAPLNSPAVEVALPTPGFLRRNRTSVVLGIEILVSLVVMALVALADAASLAVFVVVAGTTLLVRYSAGRMLLRPGLPRLERVLRDTSVPFCVAALPVAAGWWTGSHLATAAQITVAGAAVALAAALLRRWVPTAQRVVVVGSAVAIAEAATRWADGRHVEIVGSLVIDAEMPRVPRPRTGSVHEFADASQIDRASLLRSHPDMVIVVPGPGISAEHVRRIGWALEGTTTALAVQNELDGISPHRLECTSYAGASLMHITSSKPTWFAATVKSVFDRVVGALLLMLAAPLLGGLVIAVRMTSPGTGLFRQVRVGTDGAHFTMYKLRTMVATAEADKAALKADDEGAGVLFKMQADPRITPLGRVLRKFSLDELPQLINVVRGEMSLVGPRPALPSEVAEYNSLERRRLVAKPGLTGLWQVSGRSDLPWGETVRLDNHYTENWRLADDAVILVRTVDAVLRSRGAY